MNETHAEAHKLHRAGLPITLCPPGSKKPLGDGWDAKYSGKAWQRHRWTLKEIDRAFKVRGELNVGVLFGPDSELIDIEEDSPEDAQAYKELLEDCPPPVTPSFTSARGPHRLFKRHPALEKLAKATTHYRGLEVKIGAGGKGAHSLFPPSVSGGIQRRWVIPLDECPPAELPSAALNRLLANGTNGFCRTAAGEEKDKGNETQRTQRTQISHEITVSSVSSVSSVSHSPRHPPAVPSSIQKAVASTVPKAPGQRHRAIFEFARHLKSVPSLSGIEGNELRQYVEWWHELALPFIATKAFEETWYDFRNAWDSVKYPAGEEPIAIMYAKAISKPIPKCAQNYSQPQLHSLIALCRELQDDAGKDSFFLAGRTAAIQIGVEHATAARWLHMLRMDDILQLVEQGTRHQASEYKYLGD